ncbi:MAG TPA: FAD-binding oxidoreductase [Casimicrobiaceae bacterium]|nr:FAD-binding oxidoreductase [Casimicrobiaceae bacterium]
MSPYDLVVVGAGIMGSTAALQAARGGMRVAVVDRGPVAGGASGVNAGTLSLQIKRVGLMPYALRGHAWWARAGDAVGFQRTGGYTLAFNDREASLLHERMTLKREAGAPIEFVSPADVRAREPALSENIVAASYCGEDGHADSTQTGIYLRRLLREADIDLRAHAGARAIDASDGGFRVHTHDGELVGKRLLIACGAWTPKVTAMLGVTMPIGSRVNMVTVTEPGPRRLHAGIGHATGLLTLKQKANGTFLIGGGWQGRGSPDEGRGEISAETLLQNLRLARHAVPALAQTRIVRSWTGFEAFVPDHYPLAGALPGVPDAYVLACVRGGYTIGPCIGPLMADLMLGRELALPLFDPARFANAPGNASSAPIAAAAPA